MSAWEFIQFRDKFCEKFPGLKLEFKMWGEIRWCYELYSGAASTFDEVESQIMYASESKSVGVYDRLTESTKEYNVSSKRC